MKKVIMSVIGFAIALALVLGIWVPIAKKGQEAGKSTLSRNSSVDSAITDLSKEITIP